MARSSRRDFMRFSYKALGAATLLGTFPYFGAVAQAQTAKDYKAMVCIFLEGGNDGINTVVPMESGAYQYYQSVRTSFAIPQNQLLQIRPPSAGQPFGFHPSLTGLHQLWNDKKVAVIPNIGSLVAPITKEEFHANSSLRPSGLFDHYTQSLTWQFCDLKNNTGGWGNRISRYTRTFNTAPKIPMLVSVAGGSPPLLKGTDPSITLEPGANLTLAGGTSTEATLRLNALQELLKAEDTGSAQVNALNKRVADSIEDGRLVTQVLQNSTAIKTMFPNNGIGRQLGQIARIIAARDVLGLDRRQIFYVRMGGFDTHSDQMASHQRLLKELNDAMSAFYAATVELGVASAVTTFTISDFGRNIRNNEGLGTDHGWGSHAFVMGGAVKGGEFYGKYPSIEIGGVNDIDRNSKDRGSLLPTTSVDQYGSTLAAWFGLDETARRAIFPNLYRFDSAPLGFI